jgi:hypothetical protein
MGRMLEELSRLLIGWLGYYSIAGLKAHLTRISGWETLVTNQLKKSSKIRYNNAYGRNHGEES